MLKIRPLMICKESPENAVAGWGERNKQKHSAKRKEKGSFFFVVINGRIFIMAGTDRFVITRRRHPWHSSTPLWLNEPFLLFSPSPPSYLCVFFFFFTPLDAARIISPGLAHHSFPFVSPLRLRFRLFCLFIPCTTSTFTGIDSTLTCC